MEKPWGETSSFVQFCPFPSPRIWQSTASLAQKGESLNPFPDEEGGVQDFFYIFWVLLFLPFLYSGCWVVQMVIEVYTICHLHSTELREAENQKKIRLFSLALLKFNFKWKCLRERFIEKRRKKNRQMSVLGR